MNFKRIVYMLSILLLIVATTIYVVETYSRFKSDAIVNEEAHIAKWQVTLKNNEEEINNKFDVTFTSTSNNDGNVATDKFAPGISGKAFLVLDLANTEVAVDYNITVDRRTIEKQIGTSNISLDIENNEGEEISFGKDTYIPLPNKEKFTSDNGIFTFTFTLNWDGQNSDNTADTNVALDFDNLTLPIYVKIKQHVEDENYEEESRKVTSNISYVETTETKKRFIQGVNYRFDEQDILSDNPERGFFSSSAFSLNEEGLLLPDGYTDAVVKSNTTKLLYLKVNLSAFSGSMNKSGEDKPLTTAAINALKNVLERIKQNDNTVILRFVYDNNATGVIKKDNTIYGPEEDPDADKSDQKEKVEPKQDMLLQHISQLESVFKEYSKTINVIQMGFYGLWGESFYNTDVNENPEYYEQTTKALLQATAGTEITIALRTPKYYTQYKGIDLSNIDKDITTSGDESYRVGIFNDAYGASADDLGTYVNRAKETDWLHNQASHTFFGGEAIIDATTEDGIGAFNTAKYWIEEALKIHTTYINWEWNQKLHEGWSKQIYEGDDPYYKGKPALTYIESHLGYRFVIKEVRTYEKAASYETLPIDITVENVGFANLIKTKSADIVLTNKNGGIITEYKGIDFNAKDFLSQTTIKKSIEISLPSLQSGEYNIYLRLSNGEKLRNGKYYSSIQFANHNMYDSTVEANYIAKFTVD